MATTFLPSTLPLLPLAPPQLLFPHLRVSIPLSTALVQVVLKSVTENAKAQKLDDASGRVVAVVPVVDHERRVGRWACAARIVKVERRKDEEGEYRLTLEGLSRIRLPRSLPPVLSILPPLPLAITTFSVPLPDSTSPTISLIPYAQALLPKTLHSRVAALTPSMLCDLLVTVLGLDWENRVELLGIPDVEERTERVKELLLGLMANRGIPPPADLVVAERTPLTALVRRKPNAASQKPAQPPQGLPEDLLPLLRTFERRDAELTPTVKATITRELTRLAKIQPQGAEYGVAKTYIEWLLALPWKRVTASAEGKDIDLDEIKGKLDEDHEGLKEVKRRVIEYLAVYRLKKRRFMEELDRKQLANDARPTNPEKAGDGELLDPKTADDLLGLIPSSDRKALEGDNNTSPASPNPLDGDDKPPSDVFRDKGPILLLVGPPGVGKTSVARSLADAMGRKFHRISLGGVRDEAEIRGHRRTYVGALPGMLVQGLRKVGTSNPVILLDELDKVGTSSYHGDPSAALLETLDPAQNWSFHDHYLGDVPIDLSQVIFIATANTLETISPPLLDRCEVIECSGYVMDEKLAIARKYLLPRQIKESGLDEGDVALGDEGLLRVITDYTRESGVRSLERELGKVCRTKAVQYSSSEGAKYDPVVTPEDIESILGVAKYELEVREEHLRPGVVTGMVYRTSGNGGILLIETTLVPGGKGRLVLTGSLGDVIKESVELGLTWVKSRAVRLGITNSPHEDVLKGHDLHLHLPSGAVKKDGPSAGVGMVLAIVGLLTGRSVPATLAVTGEITLRGAVTPVGGIKEKVLGAHRAGIKKVILPSRNRKDVLSDLPKSLTDDLAIEFVGTVEELLEEVWGREVWVRGEGLKVEARL